MSLTIKDIASQWWIVGTGLPVAGEVPPEVPADAIGPYTTVKEARDDLKGLARFYADNRVNAAKEAFMAAQLTKGN
jgi:hypothetical protein